MEPPGSHRVEPGGFDWSASIMHPMSMQRRFWASLALALVFADANDEDKPAVQDAALAQRQSRGLIRIKGGTEGQPSDANRVNCGKPKLSAADRDRADGLPW